MKNVKELTKLIFDEDVIYNILGIIILLILCGMVSFVTFLAFLLALSLI